MMQSNQLGNQFKPAILQCFGDISQAILGHFEPYLAVVAQVLQQASSVSVTTEGNFEMMDYLTSLREGIMDAWDGIIIAMKSSGKGTYTSSMLEAYTNKHSPNTGPVSGCDF
jgi:importin subunit beta-1